MFSTYDVAKYEREKQIRELLTDRALVREAEIGRRAQAEEIRRTRMYLVRSVIHKVLPSKVAELFAPPCIPCCSPSLAS